MINIRITFRVKKDFGFTPEATRVRIEQNIINDVYYKQ